MLPEELAVEAVIGINFAEIEHPTAENIRACHQAIINDTETKDVGKMIAYGHAILTLAVTVQDAIYFGLPISDRMKDILRWSSARPPSAPEN
jgi:hypothetical protein